MLGEALGEPLDGPLLFGRLDRAGADRRTFSTASRTGNPRVTKYAASTVPVRPSPAPQCTATPIPDRIRLADRVEQVIQLPVGRRFHVRDRDTDANSPASFTQCRGSGFSVSETSTSIPWRRSQPRSSTDSGLAIAARRGRSTHVNPDGGITHQRAGAEPREQREQSHDRETPCIHTGLLFANGLPQRFLPEHGSNPVCLLPHFRIGLQEVDQIAGGVPSSTAASPTRASTAASTSSTTPTAGQNRGFFAVMCSRPSPPRAAA